jgi:hypothetical protein
MTFDEYIERMNDPRRPQGLYGPIGVTQIYRVTAHTRPAATYRTRRPLAPPPRRRPWESATDARARARLETHRQEADATRNRERFAMHREDAARYRERLQRHAMDAEHDRVVARLRRLQ